MQKLKLTKKYQKYPEYKDSGVEWIGKVPRGWRIGKTKEVFNLLKEKSFNNSESEVLSLTLNGIKVRDISNNEGQIAASYEGYRKIIKGDIVLNPMDLIRGFVDASRFEGIISPAYSTLRKKNKDTDSQFYNYFFQKHYFEGIFHPFGNGVSMDHRWTLKDNTLINFPIVVLPKVEQEKIANYLNQKLSSVDQIIEKKQKMIELLKEKRIADINYVVSNLDGNTEKLKYIAPERKLKVDVVPSNLKYIGLENVESLTGKIMESNEKIEPESSVNAFFEDDVLFGKLRPYLAKVLAVDFDGVCSGEFLTLIPNKKKIIPKFLSYKLISKDFIKLVNDSTYGTKMPRANWQFIGNQIVTYPSLDTQTKIVENLDSKIKTFEKVIVAVEQSIERLHEFKSSLISSVVTGKIKIN